jgi:hypothetical protein
MAFRAGVENLEASGVFGEAIRDWQKRLELEHTMVNFIPNFKTAKAKQQRQLTTKVTHQILQFCYRMVQQSTQLLQPNS